ncbi:MAG: tetratricopeptide repeat protein, partial [Rhodospirillales bacterium]
MKGKALQLSPEAHQAAVQAQRLLATGRAADCLRFLQSRPAPLRKAAVLLHLEGLAAFHLGRMEAAVEAFEAAAKAGLEAAPLFSDLGIARLKRGEPGPAAEAFRRAAKLEPTKAGHLDNLGKALAAAKDRDGAIRAFRKAIKLAPDDGRIAFNLGALLVEEGLLREAREPLARAHALLPGEPRIAANFARALNDQGEFDEAKAVLAPALARHPGDADLLNTLGAVMMEMGDRTGAEAVFKQAIEAAPDYAPAWLNLANLLDQLRRCDEGMVAVERVLALESENFRALSLQYGLKFSLCEWDDAYRAARAKLDAVLFEADPPVQESVMQVTISRDDPAWTDRAARRRAGRWTVGDVCDTKLRRKQARKDGQRPLKVAYFSPDFRDHPVAHLIHPLFGLHDRSRVTVTAYGLGKAEDGFYAQAVASGADHFHQFGFAKADVIAKTIAE